MRTSAVAERLICAARRRTGWGPRLVAGITGHPHATVSKVLARHGLARPARALREPARRYEWPCPGDLLHVDTKRYARFLRPGHAVTQGSARTRAPSASSGSAMSSATRSSMTTRGSPPASCTPTSALKTVTAFTTRALAWFAGPGVHARRLMSDNAWAYTRNRSLAELLSAHGIGHRLIEPYRPRTNGKVERFHQTMAREWAYGVTYASDRHRAQALPHWLQHYNERRPHSSIGGRSPISRVHNVLGQDI